MAWIEMRTRRDGGVSARVVWRLGGTRGGATASCTGFSSTPSRRGFLAVNPASKTAPKQSRVKQSRPEP